MDFTRNSGSWIFAYQSSGGPKNDDSTSARIDQHSNQGVFDWQFAQAKGGSSVNPLVNTSPTGTTGGATPTNCRQRPSGAAGTGNARPSQTNSNNDDDDDDDKPGRERRKIEIKFIQDKSRRHITFSKRKAGIMKKVRWCSLSAHRGAFAPASHETVACTERSANHGTPRPTNCLS